MGIADLTGKPVDLDGVAELVGVGMPVFVHRQQVQLVLAFQDHGVAVPQEEIVQKTQVKMGIIGQKEGISSNHVRNIPGHPGLGEATLPEVLRRDARQLLNLGRHEAAGAKGNQLVIFPGHGRETAHQFHHHSGELNDLVPVELEAGGLRVEEHQLVVFLK